MIHVYRFLCLLIATIFISAQACASEQCVILLHGLARSHRAMSKMEDFLKSQNYHVVNQDYPTTKKSIKLLAEQDLPPMIESCLKYNPDQIHFVTHSLGGIVVRQYLKTHAIPRLGNVVMLGPPNHGSPLVNFFHNNWFFRISTGQAGQDLTTFKNSTPNQLPQRIPCPLGIIAGNFSFLGKLIFHEENDGKVAISSTYLNGANDFIILPVSHTFMMDNPQVMKQVISHSYVLLNLIITHCALILINDAGEMFHVEHLLCDACLTRGSLDGVLSLYFTFVC